MPIEEQIPTKRPIANLYTFIRAIFLVLIIILAFATYLSGHSATLVQNNDTDALIYQASILLTPIFVLLIVANIVIIVLLCLKRSLYILIPCLAIAINWHMVPSIIQIGDTSNTIVSADSLTLQTYNVHQFKYGSFNNTASNILFSVHRNKVDILCLQEYSSYKDAANYKEQTMTIDDYARNVSGIPQSKTASKKSKSSFSKVFPYSCFSDQEKRMGLALFSRHPIVYSKTYKFPESNQQALLADININGKLLRIITVHLQTTSISQHHREISIMASGLPTADVSFKWNALSTLAGAVLENSSKRKSQVDMICKLIKISPHPVIVCGDMNDTPNSFTYYKFERLLNDAFKTNGSGYAYSYIPLYQSLRIDYVFHSNNIVPMKFYYRPYRWSDHSAAFFRFSLLSTAPME